MKYKVGDKICIKSGDCYLQNKDEFGYVIPWKSLGYSFSNERINYLGKNATITEVRQGCYKLDIDNGRYYWTDAMFEDIQKEVREKSEDNEWQESARLTTIGCKVCNIDWEQMRCDVAKEIYIKLVTSPIPVELKKYFEIGDGGYKSSARTAKELADIFIEELKQ